MATSAVLQPQRSYNPTQVFSAKQAQDAVQAYSTFFNIGSNRVETAPDAYGQKPLHNYMSIASRFNGNNAYLGAIITNMALTNTKYLAVAPRFNIDDSTGVSWMKLVLSPSLLPEVPEAGVTSTLSMDRVTSRTNLVRRGVGFAITMNFYETDEGKMIYFNRMQQIGNSVEMTLAAEMITSLLNADAPIFRQAAAFNVTFDMDELIVRERSTFAALHGDPHGLNKIDASLKQRATLHHTKLDTYLISTNSLTHVAFQSGNVNYSETGEESQKRADLGSDYYGRKIGVGKEKATLISVDPFMARGEVWDPLSAPYMTGEHHLMYVVTGYNVADFERYTSDVRKVAVYSDDTHQYTNISQGYAIDNMNRHTDTGKLITFNDTSYLHMGSPNPANMKKDLFHYTDDKTKEVHGAELWGNVAGIDKKVIECWSQTVINNLARDSSRQQKLMNDFNEGIELIRSLEDQAFNNVIGDQFDRYVEGLEFVLDSNTGIYEARPNIYGSLNFPAASGTAPATIPAFHANYPGLKTISKQDNANVDPAVKRTITNFVNAYDVIISKATALLPDNLALNPRNAASHFKNPTAATAAFSMISSRVPVFVKRTRTGSRVSSNINSTRKLTDKEKTVLGGYLQKHLGFFKDKVDAITDDTTNKKYASLAEIINNNLPGEKEEEEEQSASAFYDTTRKAVAVFTFLKYIKASKISTEERAKAFDDMVKDFTNTVASKLVGTQPIEQLLQGIQAFYGRHRSEFRSNDFGAIKSAIINAVKGLDNLQTTEIPPESDEQAGHYDANNTNEKLIAAYQSIAGDGREARTLGRVPLTMGPGLIVSWAKNILNGDFTAKFWPASPTNFDVPMSPTELHKFLNIHDQIMDVRSLNEKLPNALRVGDQMAEISTPFADFGDQLFAPGRKATGQRGRRANKAPFSSATGSSSFGRTTRVGNDLNAHVSSMGSAGRTGPLVEGFGDSSERSYAGESSDAIPESLSASVSTTAHNAMMQKYFKSRFKDVRSGNGFGLFEFIGSLFFFTPTDFKSFVTWDKNNVLVPIEWIISRPHMTYEVYLMIKLKAGKETIVQFLNNVIAYLGANASTQTIIGSITLFHAAVVLEPNNVAIIQNAHVHKYIGGAGTTPFKHGKDKYNPVPGTNALYGERDKRQDSVFIFAVPIGTEARANMSITGSYSSATPLNVHESKELHYSSAEFYDLLWGWSKTTQSNQASLEFEAAHNFDERYANLITSLGCGILSGLDGKKYFQHGCAAWGPSLTFPGAKNARFGTDSPNNTWYSRMETLVARSSSY